MIQVNCQSSIRIIGAKVLYFDPLKQKETHDADYIFITHPHWDHFSKEDIQKIKKQDTKLIVPKSMEKDVENLNFEPEEISFCLPNQQILLDNLKIETVKAYNQNKEFHPKNKNWLGYVITFQNQKYYIPGDTDILEENKKIICDVLFVPIGGTYTMNSQEAAEFTNLLKPKKVIPIHYQMLVGTEEDYQKFLSLVDSKIQVERKIKR